MDVLVVTLAAAVGGIAGRWLRQVYFPHDSCVLDASLGLSLALVLVRLVESLPVSALLWNGSQDGMSEVGHWLCGAMVLHCTVVVPTWWSYSLLESYEWCWGGRCAGDYYYCRGGSRYWSLPTSSSAAATAEEKPTPKPYRTAHIVHLSLSVILGITLSCLSLPWIIETLVIHGSNRSASFLDTTMSGLFAIGVLLAAALNGFGSVILPYTFCIGWWIHPVHPSCLVGAEQALAHTRAMLQQRLQARPTVKVQQKLPRTFLGLGRAIQQQSATLRTEVAFLETLMEEQEADLAELRTALQTTQRAQTTIVGRCSLYVGCVFSLILVYRLGVSIWHVVTPTVAGRQAPPIELVVAKFVVSLVWPVQKSDDDDDDDDYDEAPIITLEEATQYASLLIALVLRVSATRNFLRRAGSIQRHVNCISSNTTTLLLSLATGCYALATVTAGNRFLLRPGIVDLVYVTTAVATSAVLVVVAHIVRANTLRYHMDSSDTAASWRSTPSNCSSGRSNCDRVV